MTVSSFVFPRSLDEVFDLLAEHGDDARLIAGGTALALLMRQRLVRPSVLVSLDRVEALKGVARTNGRLAIGATTTQRFAEIHAEVRNSAPLLAETLQRVATIRIRNVATIGGNLVHADPNQDPPVALIALDASVALQSRKGVRSLPLSEFFTDYYETALESGEVLTDVSLPAQSSGNWAFTKFLPRTADDYATVSVAAIVPVDAARLCNGVRIALGSAGPTSIRARSTESVLEGKHPTSALIRAAAMAVRDEVDPLDDGRGSASYKRDMAALWVERTVTEALERGGIRL